MRAKAYDKELRENIVKLHLEKNRTISSLSEEFGIAVSTISRWVIVFRNKSVVNSRFNHNHQDGVK